MTNFHSLCTLIYASAARGMWQKDIAMLSLIRNTLDITVREGQKLKQKYNISFMLKLDCYELVS